MPGFNPNFNPDFNPDAVAPKFNAAFNPDFDPDVEAKPAKTSDGTIVAAPASVQDMTSIKGLPRFATILGGGSRLQAPAGGLQKVIDQNRAAREAQVERLVSQGMPREQAETYEVGSLSGLSPEAWQETLAQDEARRKSAPLRAFEGVAHGVATPIVNLANAPSGLVREAGKIAESAGLDKAGKRIQAAGQAIRPTEARRVLEETAPLTDVGQVADFAGHVAGLVPTIGALGPAGSLRQMMGFATQSAGNTMNEALDSGAGAGKALTAGLLQAAKDVALMKAARLVPALQTRNPTVGAVVNSMSTNAGLGLALTYGGNLIDKLTWDPKRKVFDGTKDALTTGLAFGLLHAPQAMRAAEYRRMASEHPGGVEGFMAELQAKKDILAKTAGEMDRTVTLDPQGNRIENYDRLAFDRVNGSVHEALRVARAYRDSLLKQGKLKDAMGTGQVNKSQAPPADAAVPPPAGPLPVVTPTTPSEAPRVEAPLPSPPAGPEGPVAQSGAPLTVTGEAPGIPAQPDAGPAPVAGSGGGGGEPVGTPPVEVSALVEQAQALDAATPLTQTQIQPDTIQGAADGTLDGGSGSGTSPRAPSGDAQGEVLAEPSGDGAGSGRAGSPAVKAASKVLDALADSGHPLHKRLSQIQPTSAEPVTGVGVDKDGVAHTFQIQPEGHSIHLMGEAGLPGEDGKPRRVNAWAQVLPHGGIVIRSIDNGGHSGLGPDMTRALLKFAKENYKGVTDASTVFGGVSESGKRARMKVPNALIEDFGGRTVAINRVADFSSAEAPEQREPKNGNTSPKIHARFDRAMEDKAVHSLGLMLRPGAYAGELRERFEAQTGVALPSDWKGTREAIAKHFYEQPIKGVIHGGPAEILQLLDAPKKPGRQAVRYLNVDEASAQRLQDASEGAVMGVDGFHHTVDKDALIHAMKQHGDPGVEARRNQQPLIKEDFARLPEIVSEPDEVVYQGKTKGLDRFLYKKAFNGTTFFVEEVRRSRHELAAVTLWKVPTRVLMQGSPAPNIRPSDVSDGRPPQGKPNSMPADGIGKAEESGLGFTVDGEKHQIPADRADLIGRLQAAKDAMEKRQAEISSKIGMNKIIRAKLHKKAGDEFATEKRRIRDAMIPEEPVAPMPGPDALRQWESFLRFGHMAAIRHVAEDPRTTPAQARAMLVLLEDGLRASKNALASVKTGSRNAIDIESVIAKLKDWKPELEKKSGEIEEESLQGMSHPLAPVLKSLFGARVRPDSVSIPSAFEEVEKRWQEAKKGAESTPLLTKAIESLRKAKASFTQHFKYINPNDSPLMAQLNDVLRRHEAGPAFARAVAHDMVYEVTKNLGPKRVDLFTRVLVLRDILRNVNEGVDDVGEELPFGYKNLDEAQHDLSRFERALNHPDNEPVRDAMKGRNDRAMAIVKTLVGHGILNSDALDNVESYYHRQVMTYMNSRAVGSTGGDLRMKRKGFQIARQGGAHDFNARYEQAEAEWVADAMALIVKKETLDELERLADISGRLQAQADSMNRSRLAEIDRTLDEGIIESMPIREIEAKLGDQALNWKTLLPEDYALWQPEVGNHFYPALTLSERLLDKFLAGEADLAGEDFKSVLALGAKKKQWAIPENLARQLDHMVDPEAAAFDRFWVGAMSTWKQWQLISPFRLPRYTLNNMAGDMDIVTAYNPRIIKEELARAASDLWSYQIKHDAGDGIAEEIRAAIRAGVVDSGLTMEEIPDIDRTGAFRILTSDRPNGNAIQKAWGGVKAFATWRENILRLAAYRWFQKELAKGKHLYAASSRAEIDAIPRRDRKAAKLARELVGDYGNVSVAGQYIRTHMIPFYSWMEVNAPRYVRLLKNLPHEGQPAVGEKKADLWSKDGQNWEKGDGLPNPALARLKFAGQVAATKVPLLALRMAALSILIYLWNKLMFKDEHKILMRQKGVKNGIILGRRDDGSIRYLRTDLAIGDALEWFSLGDAPTKMNDLAAGKISMADIAADAAKGPAEKIIKGWEPVSKSIFELVLGRSASYPSVWREGATTKQAGMPIRDKTGYILKNITPLDRLYNKITHKPQRRTDPANAVLDALLTYSIDSGEASYFLARDIANDWAAKNLNREERARSANFSEKGNALYYFKRATQWGDRDNAEYWLNKYYEFGGKPKDIQQAIKRGHPLGAIPPARRGQFTTSLNASDREVLADAVDWYHRLNPETRSIMAGHSKIAGTEESAK